MSRLAGKALTLLPLLLFSCSSPPLTYQQISTCSVEVKRLNEVEKLANKGFGEAQLCAGKLLLKEGKSTKAREYLLKAFKQLSGRKRGETAYLVGKTYLMEKKVNRGRSWFFKAIENGYPNREFFKTSYYLSLKELKEIEELGKEEPILYLYLGDYLRENELYKGALFYYQLAIRYGVKEARIGSAVSLFKLGNRKLAVSILKEEFRKGKKEAANVLGELLLEEASSVGKGNCLLISESDPEEFLRRRIKQIKEKARLYKEAYSWFIKANNRRKAKESFYLYEVYSLKKRAPLPRENFTVQELKRLCRKGNFWAEYLLSQRIKTPSSKAASILYEKLFNYPAHLEGR